ncbi:MAG TPA: hypothetical protein V6C65_22975, partial [Allocoleopsis sp.]
CAEAISCLEQQLLSVSLCLSVFVVQKPSTSVTLREPPASSRAGRMTSPFESAWMLDAGGRNVRYWMLDAGKWCGSAGIFVSVSDCLIIGLLS